MWPSNLVDFIKALHNVDVVWRPKTPEEECPVRGVRWSGHSADIGIEQALLLDDRAELRQLQKELGIDVTI
jgi:hypothetical protein